MTTSTTPTIVLVHGAFADASGFADVIRELQSAGHTRRQTGTGLSSDTDTLACKEGAHA
jgi:hypothetical protein